MNKKISFLFLTFSLPYMLNGMNTQPIVISTPGLFQLVGTLEFALTAPGQACIIVNSNDVVIDLDGFSIRQGIGFEQPNTEGILINPNVQNVTIKNGTITNMTNYGIHLLDNTNSIYLTNLIINDAQNAGVFADSNRTEIGIDNIFLDNVTTESIFNFNGSPAYGVLLKFVNSARITNRSLAHNIQTTTGNCYGLKLKDCNSIIIDSYVSNNNIGGGVLTSGIFLAHTKDCKLDNCFSLNNSCTGLDPSAVTLGFAFTGSGNIECNDCLSVDNACTFSACGFFSDATNGIQYRNCQGNGSISNNLDGIGFSANNALLVELHNCIAKGNGGANNGYGVVFNTMDLSAIEDCDIRGNTGFTGTSYGIALISTTTSSIQRNTIDYNVGGPISFGFFDNAGAGTTNVIVSNIAIKNGTNYSPGAATIPIYNGNLASFNSSNPFIFQNVSI